MKNVKIDSITTRKYTGKVYNLELKSNVKNPKLDDLYWIDAKSGLISHNCFPKDIQAIIHYAKSLGVEMNTLEGAWSTNWNVRLGLKEKDDK